MHTITPSRIVILLALYAGLWVVISATKREIQQDEKKTFLVVSASLAVAVFAANYLLFRAGVMSFLPWMNNFLHTFVWIGVCLTWLYFASSKDGLVRQFVLFATFSLIVKYAEQLTFGTWEHGHFFGIQGNFAYVLGWSLLDGLLPVVIRAGLHVLARLGVDGLVTIRAS